MLFSIPVANMKLAIAHSPWALWFTSGPRARRRASIAPARGNENLPERSRPANVFG
jgi:hypothetical protein